MRSSIESLHRSSSNLYRSIDKLLPVETRKSVPQRAPQRIRMGADITHNHTNLEIGYHQQQHADAIAQARGRFRGLTLPANGVEESRGLNKVGRSKNIFG